MSLPTISNTLRDTLAARIDQASSRLVDNQRPQDASLNSAAQSAGTKPPITAPVVQRAAANPLSAQAPEGTDPQLWSVLTSDERAFFARTVTSGPLTYSKIMTANKTPAVPSIRGGRLDLRA